MGMGLEMQTGDHCLITIHPLYARTNQWQELVCQHSPSHVMLGYMKDNTTLTRLNEACLEGCWMLFTAFFGSCFGLVLLGGAGCACILFVGMGLFSLSLPDTICLAVISTGALAVIGFLLINNAMLRNEVRRMQNRAVLSKGKNPPP